MRRMNRYAQKRRHKRELEKKYARGYGYGTHREYDVKALRRRLELEAQEDCYWNRKHPPRNNGWEYWKLYDMTGMRQYAKKFSDKRIRQKYRIMIRKMDPEDAFVPQGADYEKEYDYEYTIW